MTETERINELLGIRDSYEAPARLMEILYDRPRREALFMEFLREFNYDVNRDWFHAYFQDEHADRKKKKQDFTPSSVSRLVTGLVGGAGGGMHYEPCAGTGGMTITRWDYDRRQHSPFDYWPSDYFYVCEELSDRAFPFLLFNLLIRGMNAAVIHCDVLSRTAYGVFFVQNDDDDHMKFSSLNLMPQNEDVEDFLAVKFVEQRYKPIMETTEIPVHLSGIIQEMIN